MHFPEIRQNQPFFRAQLFPRFINGGPKKARLTGGIYTARSREQEKK